MERDKKKETEREKENRNLKYHHKSIKEDLEYYKEH